MSKKYKLYDKNSDKLMDLFSLNKKAKEFYALRNLSFEVYEGETIGVIGINGAGKSTLSNLLAQVIPPTSGEVKINGVVSLIAISAGLNNNLTGIENIKLKCLMLGLNNEQINEILPDIIEFADIGTFIDQPVKNYSSGMRARLGFAISVQIDPDILVIDEALSVGDSTFYDKCLKKINEFKSHGKTIFFISHSVSQVRKMSDKVLWLNNGRLQEFGSPETVLKQYKSFIDSFNNMNDAEKKAFKQKEAKERFTQNADVNMSNEQNFSLRKATSSRSVENKNNKRKARLFYFQILFFFVCFLISGSAVVFDFPSHFSASRLDIRLLTEIDKEEKQELQTIEINQNGFIAVEGSAIYKNVDFTDKIYDIEFASPIFVQKQIGNEIYQITYNNRYGYINKEEVKLNNLKNDFSYSFIDTLALFPETFKQSFEFYLAFLSSSEDEIKSRLKGLTSEEINDNGEKVLSFDYDKVSYYINDKGIATDIMVEDVEVDEETMNMVNEISALKLNDGTIFLIKTTNGTILYLIRLKVMYKSDKISFYYTAFSLENI